MAASEKAENPLKYLDKLLGRYYEMQGNKTYYQDDTKTWEDDEKTPKGKFGIFSDINGIEADDVEEELQADPEDCIYTDFDEEGFPLDKSIKIESDEQKAEEIYNVIKYCWDNGKAPRYFSALNIELNTDQEDIKKVEEQYKEQCPKIFHTQEETLKEVFAIGLKNQFPFISYLVDAYQRDRMLSQGQDLTVATWAKQSPYIKKVNGKSKSQAHSIQSGIETYMKRVAPRFHLKAMNKVQDNIQDIIKYFISAGQFVEHLLNDNTKQTTPFSYDLVIVVKRTVSNSTMVLPNLSDDDDDDDDDDDFKDDDDGNGGKDYFANIDKKLTSNGCPFVKESITDDRRGTRFLVKVFKEFEQELKKNKYKGGDMKSYPRKKRFCSLIDRRGGANDKLVMFEPPDDSNTIPNNHVPDWYFNAGKTCIVPNIGYKKGVGVKKEYDPQDTIRVDNPYKGQTITISFHVEGQDSIRCYLFWNGCYIRIVYPDDLKKILDSIFDTEFGKNKAYLNGDKAKDDMNKILVNDETFNAFYKEVSIMNKKT